MKGNFYDEVFTIIKIYPDCEKMFTDKIFDSKSLDELVNDIDFEYF